MIELKNVNCAYENKTIFQKLTLSLPQTGVVAVTGPSGKGKTTFLRLLAGLVKPQSGMVEGLGGLRVSVVFQEDRLLPWLTALENVCVVCNDAALAQKTLEALELGDALHKKPPELSGGMQRRVALARALCFGGDVLLLDEPFKGLDDALKTRVANVVKGAFPLTVVATHDISEAELLGQMTRIEI